MSRRLPTNFPKIVCRYNKKFQQPVLTTSVGSRLLLLCLLNFEGHVERQYRGAGSTRP